jgi:hypothetical protein
MTERLFLSDPFVGKFRETCIMHLLTCYLMHHHCNIIAQEEMEEIREGRKYFVFKNSK